MFAVQVARLCNRLQSKRQYVLSNQILKCGTSVGANVREALNTMTDRDFIYKLSIAQKEYDESLFWLELLSELQLVPEAELLALTGKADEILRILRSIILTTQGKIKPSNRPHSF